MEWIFNISAREFALIGIFGGLYLVFLFRTILKARKLNVTPYKLVVKLLIRTAYFSLLIMALLGPSFGSDKKEIKTIAKDIFIAVDLSESMNATDVQPSRLEKVKYEMKNLMEAFSSDRIGIIIFSSEAFVQCPLTYDQGALSLFIETLGTGLVPNAGTDFSPPLSLALDKLIDEDNKTDKNAKVIILISDGENFGDETKDVISDIKDEGIKLFALGVGTREGSKIPDRRGFKKDKTGNEVITKLDNDALKQLVYKTKGQYFEINAELNESKRLINEINKIEGELRDAKKVDVSANKYLYFLLGALALAVVDILITVKVFKI